MKGHEKMPTLKQLKEKLNKTFKVISATPPEVAGIIKDKVLVRYEERDYETGSGIKSYLITVCDMEGNILTPISYESQELCERVIKANALFDESKIQKILNKYNKEKYQ